MKTQLFPRRDGRLSVFATGMMADGESVNFSINASKIKALQDSCAASCDANCAAIQDRQVPMARALPQHIMHHGGTELSMAERPNRRGELHVAVVICNRTGRGRAVYPGQSVAAVAARLGAVDWAREPVGMRA